LMYASKNFNDFAFNIDFLAIFCLYFLRTMKLVFFIKRSTFDVDEYGQNLHATMFAIGKKRIRKCCS
jgi:hypothetical protein